ncbi:TlpA family protein disulfide reductase [Hydrogenothermus marinus]|uniref:Thiol-disulfide isomerase/thioredoxin n=1 Tax=Hydrogenothermus marinus TaxID=133270 RepID=A0A3M0BII6_9AQUI|nr:TlpA disulfide reductase family protein [Hydrogenothermus marinus]RMA97190.1 thiol-disulfide isomerase/thioredoxin [Hydrogenothermus marinus]
MRLLLIILILFGFSFAKTIPDFKLLDENRKVVKRDDLKGKPSVLIFWGLYCGSCKKELPIIEKYYERYKNKINFYAIVLESENSKDVEEIKKAWGFNIPVLLNGKKIMYKYKIFGVPISYFVDKDLKVKKILIGKVPEEKIKKEIENLLK